MRTRREMEFFRSVCKQFNPNCRSAKQLTLTAGLTPAIFVGETERSSASHKAVAERPPREIYLYTRSSIQVKKMVFALSSKLQRSISG